MPTTRPSPNPVRPGTAVGGERGFTLIEVMVAALVLTVGVLGLFATLNLATDTTRANRERQAENSLGRAVIEDALTLPYTQLTPQSLAGALQPLLVGSTVSGQGLVVIRSIYTFNVDVSSVCALDDPTDGIGNHTSPPPSGGSWCTDVAPTPSPNPNPDTNPDDQKRLTVVVTPSTGTGSLPTVTLSTLIRAQKGNGPSVSCLTLTQSVCPGANQTITTASTTALTFYVSTTTAAQSVQWQVNGGTPPSAQMPTGAADPYPASGTTSQFTWTLPPADGTYTISAAAQDTLGNTGSRSTLQITLHRHPPAPPTTVTAGYDRLIGGTDVQWVPSIDQDALYYNVYSKIGTSAPTLVCSQVSGTTCTDLTAPSPGPSPSQCSSPLTDVGSQPNYYYVVAWGPDSTGTPHAGAASQSVDANLCDVQPPPPTNLSVTASGGAATLTWTAPASMQSIQGWRIYRWASGGTVNYQTNRLSYVGAVTGNQTVTSFIDSSADPGGLVQSYCVTSVDTRLNESPCSNTGSG